MISIVTVLHNSAPSMPDYLENILVGFDSRIHEIVLVDNGSDVRIDPEWIPDGFRLIEQENRGFAAGCNAGWTVAKNEWVYFVNPDVTVTTRDLMATIEAVDERPGVAIVGPHISRADSFSGMMGPPWRTRRYPVGEVIATEPRLIKAASISGSCFAVRKSALQESDGLDERFFMYCEENDLQKRVQDSGFMVCVAADIHAHHVGGGGSDNKSLNRDSERLKSKKLFYQKHYTPLEYLVMKMVGWSRTKIQSIGGKKR